MFNNKENPVEKQFSRNVHEKDILVLRWIIEKLWSEIKLRER